MIVFETPTLPLEIWYREFEFNRITSVSKDSLYKGYGCSIILINSWGSYIGLIEHEGVRRLIRQANGLIHYSIPHFTVKCTGGLKIILIRIYNSIAEYANVVQHPDNLTQLTIEELYKELGKLLEDLNRDITISFRNIENLDFEVYDNLSHELTSYRVHLVAICNRPGLYERFKMLKNVDLVIPINPPKKKQLLILYLLKAEELGLKLPERVIEYIIDLQYHQNIFHRQFGFEILNDLVDNQ